MCELAPVRDLAPGWDFVTNRSRRLQCYTRLLALMIGMFGVVVPAPAQTSELLPPAPPLNPPPEPGLSFSPATPGAHSFPIPLVPSPNRPQTPNRLQSVETNTATQPPLGRPITPAPSPVDRVTVGHPDYPNGYTYVAPSYYLTPPVITPVVPYGFAPEVGITRGQVTVFEPAFMHTTVMPYDPVWPYAYMGLPAPYYRERVTVGPAGVDYRLRTYTPRGRRLYR